MKTADRTGFVTVGELVGELSRFLNECPDYNVVCWDPEDRTCCMVDVESDEDGDLCIRMEEDEEYDTFYESVNTLLDTLDQYASDTPVYMAACGQYLGFVRDSDGHVFFDEPDDEVVGCYGVVIGEYDEPDESDDTQASRILARQRQDGKCEDRIYSIVLVLLDLLAAGLLFGNIRAIVTGAGQYLLENIMWIACSVIVLTVCSLTLYCSSSK